VHLARLKLTAAAEHLPAILADAKARGCSMTATLGTPAGREVAATKACRLADRRGSPH
jgi:hypothetical protein